jgi:hypothetical protein
MDRRTFLATTATTLGISLGGCLASNDGESDETPEEPGEPADTETPDDEPTSDGDPPSTDRPTDDPTPTDENDHTPLGGVLVEDVVARKAVTYESVMGSGGVLTDPDQQYVVATVRADGELDPEAFAFETDEGSWEPGLSNTRGATNLAVAGHGEGAIGSPISPSPPSYLAFAVSSPLSASTARITYEDDHGGRWDLSDAQRERLGAPAPEFERQGLTVPDEISQGETLSVSLTVENVSDVDGRFLAAVYWPTDAVADDDESHVVERQVAAGERVTATLDIDTEYTAMEDGPVTLSVDGHVSGERTVGVDVDVDES